jgi:hypothetical protein
MQKATANGSRKLQKNTLEYAEYVLLFTTLIREKFSGAEILEVYRWRWQVELVLKRLKSLLELGHLHKYDDTSSRAWLSGKILVSILIELMLQAGEKFFPWGYPLRED